jgi:hypothetical protein
MLVQILRWGFARVLFLGLIVITKRTSCQLICSSVNSWQCRRQKNGLNSRLRNAGRLLMKLVDWRGLFTSKSGDRCVDQFYDVMWCYFERCCRKFPWVTKEPNDLKNKTTRATKRIKESERRCMMNVDIDECDCEELRADFIVLRTDY